MMHLSQHKLEHKLSSCLPAVTLRESPPSFLGTPPSSKKKGQPFLPSPRESVDKPINEIKVSESLPEAEPCLLVMGENNLNQTSSSVLKP